MKTQLCLVLVVLAVYSVKSASISDNEFHQIVNQYGPRDVADVLMEDEDARLNVPQIIKKYGYPVEVHEVTTADGYILTMHRIPHGKKSGPAPNKPVVWLQHGLMCDSSNWIQNNKDKALGYVMADLGYDVWLGNARGNTYSKKHVKYTEKDPEFWQFSWHEMGVYDVPAVLDHVLKTSGQPDLYYVGHSMGTTMFFVAMAEKPELNSKIKLMSALAPIAYVEHMSSPIALIAPFVDQIEWILRMMGVNEFMPTGPLMDFLGKTICNVNSPVQALCSNVLFLIAGYNVEQLNKTAIPIIIGHTPAGSSVKSVVHYAQEYNSGIFRKYDFGKKGNQERYGQDTPPEYDISKITAPVALYYGDNDWLGPPADVYRFAEELPNMVRKFRVRHDKYNHLDFLWAIDNDFLLNNEVIKYIEMY